eukprot:m.17555 g.17555  ORF g.17555 m.17555 type:complete len:116 (+) comp10673_c0_seq24:220-567(+)
MPRYNGHRRTTKADRRKMNPEQNGVCKSCGKHRQLRAGVCRRCKKQETLSTAASLTPASATALRLEPTEATPGTQNNMATGLKGHLRMMLEYNVWANRNVLKYNKLCMYLSEHLT